MLFLSFIISAVWRWNLLYFLRGWKEGIVNFKTFCKMLCPISLWTKLCLETKFSKKVHQLNLELLNQAKKHYQGSTECPIDPQVEGFLRLMIEETKNQTFLKICFNYYLRKIYYLVWFETNRQTEITILYRLNNVIIYYQSSIVSC